jgi:hypothetical protein
MDDQAAAALAGLAQGQLGAALHWHRIELLTTLRDVGSGIAEGLARSPETFAKRCLALATDLVARDAAARKAATSTGEDETAENGVEEEAPDDADTESVEPTTTRGAAKRVATDQLRDALKLVLLTLSAVLRDALVAQAADKSSGAPSLLAREFVPCERISRDWSAAALADAIGAISDAERMIDRNVAPQLACERLAIALTAEALHA